MSTVTSSLGLNALRWYTKFLCVYVLFVIFAGALVTSHDAGLSVPDWPTTYGENMFLFPVYKWVDGIFYEHGHRLVAFGIGTLTLILAPWMWLVEKRKWVRVLSYAALGIVILQGLLGGLTVLLGLHVAVSSLHGVLAQTFLGIILILAYAQSTEYQLKEAIGEEDKALITTAFVTVGAIYLQLIVGAVMRHSAAGLAILDFPTMAGSFVPSVSDETVARINEARKELQFGPVTSWQVTLHLLHRLGALIVVGVVGYLIFKAKSLSQLSPKVKSLIRAIEGVVLVQFALGVITVLSVRNPFIASIHVLTGALLLALSVLLSLRVLRKKSLE